MTCVCPSPMLSANPRKDGWCERCGKQIPVLVPADARAERQADFEREFLRGAEKLAALDIGWAQRVEDRMLRMERTKGRDSYRRLDLSRGLVEIDEEGLDLGGWPVLAALLTFASDLPDNTAHEVRLLLQAIAAHGVRASGLVRELRELIV